MIHIVEQHTDQSGGAGTSENISRGILFTNMFNDLKDMGARPSKIM